MIRKLRNNFIRVMLLSLLIVMILLIGIINVAYLINFRDQAYETIDFVEENYLRMRLPGDAGPMGPGIPGTMEGSWQHPEDDDDDWDEDRDDELDAHLFSGFRRAGSALTPDTRYETSFFVVSLGSDGAVSETDHSYIASVSEEDIEEYAKKILASGREKGRLDYFMYKVFPSDDGTSKIVAVSCYQQLRQFRLLLSVCILAGLLYMAAVFALVWLMSRRITQPVEESIQKQRQFFVGLVVGFFHVVPPYASSRSSRITVETRAISLLTAVMRIGFSSWLIASWKRRLKSSSLRSFSLSSSSLGVNSLNSLAVMLKPPLPS